MTMTHIKRMLAFASLGLAVSATPGRADEVGNKVVAGAVMTTTIYGAKCDPLFPDEIFFGILDALAANLSERGIRHQFYIAMKYAARYEPSPEMHAAAPIIAADLNAFCAQSKLMIEALRAAFGAGSLAQDLRQLSAQTVPLDRTQLGIFAPPERQAPYEYQPWRDRAYEELNKNNTIERK
jgi:hypothetical protein